MKRNRLGTRLLRNPAVLHVLDISTGHITEKDDELLMKQYNFLDSSGAACPVTALSTGYGLRS